MVALLVGTDEGLVELGPGVATGAVHLEGRRIDAVADDGTGWWALVDGAEVWHAAADRTGWRHRATTPDGTRLTCLLPRTDGLLVGTAGAHLLRLDGGGALVPVDAFDRLESRAVWYTPWGGPPDTRWLAMGAAGTVLAGVHVGGVVSSSDDGRSWHQTDLDIHADVHQVITVADHGLALAACAEGLAVSGDGGDHWRIDDHGLHATYARAVAVAAACVVLSVSSGPAGHQSALYRRPLGGDAPFERCRDGLPEWFEGNIDTGALTARHDTVAAATASGEIWRSDDRAATWTPATAAPGPVSCLALAH